MTDHQRDTEEQEFKDFMESMSLTGFPIAVGHMARRGAEQIHAETENLASDKCVCDLQPESKHFLVIQSKEYITNSH